MTIPQTVDTPIKWAWHTPARHSRLAHRSRTVGFVDVTSDQGEVCLECCLCEMRWHTAIPDTGDYYETERLIAAAKGWIQADARGQRPALQIVMTFALLLVSEPTAHMTKRRYTAQRPVDTSAQLSLFAMAA